MYTCLCLCIGGDAWLRSCDVSSAKTITFFSTKNYDFNQFWVEVAQPRFTFRAAACAAVRLALSATPGVTDKETHELVIGGKTNTQWELHSLLYKPIYFFLLAQLVVRRFTRLVLSFWRTQLRNSTNGATLKMVETPNILQCNEMRSFWVSWENDVIDMGVGDIPGKSIILTYNEPNMHRVSAAKLCTFSNYAGRFEVYPQKGMVA